MGKAIGRDELRKVRIDTLSTLDRMLKDNYGKGDGKYQTPPTEDDINSKEDSGYVNGYFHTWGGSNERKLAIVEHENGMVEEVNPGRIKFVESFEALVSSEE